MTLARRFVWLVSCVALGLAIALTGLHFTADPAWYLAIPAVVAAGWLVIADPTKCMPARQRDAGEGHISEKP